MCTACGAEAPAWTGRCSACEGWATVEEQATEAVSRQTVSAATVPLDSFSGGGSVPLPTGVDEVDRVLGGGLVPGSVTLISGEPGIGKSTLTLQVALSVAASGSSVVLVTGEEAPTQVAARAARLGPMSDTLVVLDHTEVETITDVFANDKPQLVVVDSVQTLRAQGLDAAPGSVSQVRESAGRLVAMAKRHQVTVLLVGHVTKDGSLAGPRLLEHVVDTVLSFDGDRASELRFLRSAKHRFGPTTEVGLFEMSGGGLSAVADPSQRFLADRPAGASGSVVVPVLDGHRPVLVELQALVASCRDQPASVVANGIPASRLKLVLAVLEQRAGQSMTGQDIFASIAGGGRTDDPGLDLALALALWSSRADQPLGDNVVACGEVGLTGELRAPVQLERRLQEAYRMGFRRAIVPSSTGGGPTGLELVRCASLPEAVRRASDRQLQAA